MPSAVLEAAVEPDPGRALERGHPHAAPAASAAGGFSTRQATPASAGELGVVEVLRRRARDQEQVRAGRRRASRRRSRGPRARPPVAAAAASASASAAALVRVGDGDELERLEPAEGRQVAGARDPPAARDRKPDRCCAHRPPSACGKAGAGVRERRAEERGDADELVEDVERKPGEREPRPAAAPQQRVEGAVERDDGPERRERRPAGAASARRRARRARRAR